MTNKQILKEIGRAAQPAHTKQKGHRVQGANSEWCNWQRP